MSNIADAMRFFRPKRENSSRQRDGQGQKKVEHRCGEKKRGVLSSWLPTCLLPHQESDKIGPKIYSIKRRRRVTTWNRG